MKYSYLSLITSIWSSRISFLGVLFCLLISYSCHKKGLQRLEGEVFGTTYHITSDLEAFVDFNDIFNEFNHSMSVYISDSDISRINRNDLTTVTDIPFRKVFRKSKEVWKNTGGFFDPTIKSLVDAWGFGTKEVLDTLSKNQLSKWLNLTGMEKVSLNADGTIYKSSPDISLDFNALAKGYCVDIIADNIHSKGADNYLVEIGGEVVARGINTESGRPWIIGIDNPVTSQENKHRFIVKILLKNRAMATSGGYRKYKIDPETGERYSHIINPKTGYPTKSNILSSTVVADTCMEADAYATAFMIMPLEEVKKIIKSLNLEVFIVFSQNKRTRTFASKGFRKMIIEDKSL